MRGGWVPGWCSLIVSGALIAGCGRASRNARADGAGGTLDTSSGGGSGFTGGAGSAVAGSATGGVGGMATVGGVAGSTTGGDGGSSTGAEVGGAGGEPSTLEDGGQGGLAALDPEDWRLELEVIEPTEQQLAAAQAKGVTASSGVIEVSEDGTRALAAATFPGPDRPDGTLLLSELISWTKEGGSVSLGRLEGLEPAFNTDAPHQFDIRYLAWAWTKDLKVVAGSVDGSVVDHAFVWREGEGMTELELPGAPYEVTAQMSDDGKVVVVVTRDFQRPPHTFRFDASGRTDLGMLPGFDGLEALYLSPDGSRVIGEASKSCQSVCEAPVPFSWQLGGEPQTFDLPPGAQDCSFDRSYKPGSRGFALQCALASDPHVRVVWSDGLGWRQIPGVPVGGYLSFLTQDGSAAVGASYPNPQVWRWDSATGTTVLSLPAGLTYNWLIAVSDDAKTTLVQVENTGYRRITLKWTADGELVTLPAPPGGTWPTARGISADATRIYGWGTGVGGTNVLWLDNRAYFLERLFAQSGVDLTGLGNMYSYDLSRDGHILSGYFDVNVDGVDRYNRGWFTRLP
jgi:hypothetical protein